MRTLSRQAINFNHQKVHNSSRNLNGELSRDREAHCARFARLTGSRKNVDVSPADESGNNLGSQVRTGKKAVVRLDDIARVEASFREVGAFTMARGGTETPRSPSRARPALFSSLTDNCTSFGGYYDIRAREIGTRSSSLILAVPSYFLSWHAIKIIQRDDIYL